MLKLWSLCRTFWITKTSAHTMSFWNTARRRCDPDALTDFYQVSCLAFNMTICGTTPAAPGPLVPCHFLPNTAGAVSFPCHQMTGWLLWRANERKRGQMKRNYRTAGSSFPPPCNTIHRINPPTSTWLTEKLRATQQLLALEKDSFEKIRVRISIQNKNGCNLYIICHLFILADNLYICIRHLPCLRFPLISKDPLSDTLRFFMLTIMDTPKTH